MSLTMTIFDVFESNGLLPLIAALALIGALWLLCLVLKTVCRIVRGLRAYVFPLRFPPNLQRYGSWAIITGSTDGIGKGYAEELASRGLNVFLISRNQQKLDQVAAEMEKFGVQVKTLAIDFGSEENYFDKIKHQVSSMSDIGILVNNVGIGYDFPEYFLEVEGGEKLYQDMIRINMTSMTMMTHIVLPKMVENRRGLVINLSSVSGEGIPMPLLAVYSASKAYADFFSRALHGEYSSRGITVQSVLPGYVATNLSKIRQARLDAPSPRTFARSALGTVGKFERTNGYWIHSMMAWFMFDLVPVWIIKIILVRELIKARNAGLKSKERE